MMLSWRLRRAGHRGNKKRLGDNLDMEITIPTHFRCPISLDLMKDPVTLHTGITYDRENIEKWIEAGNETCPVTNQVLRTFDQIPNHSIRKMIQAWCVENRCYGIERISTPRIPVTRYEVSEICSRIVVATQRVDEKKCQELVVKIKNWGKESERNRRCIVENGAGCVLAASFESFASVSMEKHVDLLGEILTILTWVFPLGEEGQSKLGSTISLICIAWFLKSGDLSARQSAVLVLKELLSLDQRHVKAAAKIEDIVEELVKLIKEPICPSATKASLTSLYYMLSASVTSSEKMITRFVELGLVLLLLEILVDGEKDICEKAMGVLEGICDSKQGREVAYSNALIVPVLVKKILRVSDLVTEFSVSILWKLCKNDNRKEGGVVVEALQLGTFQKLLVLLQVGCGDRTKERATELLKLLNLYRDKLDCGDLSTDFKYLKRPF
ncbi:U-box domain-containing protein [Cephalotus follicularis]|uniref:U-box domain-containing protein n=1 Tax=Cephalotus follicularis TaxID=3775 RepID=A0A1Q3AY18_CEPFO|nr:U-box domain-containing protein [Cephalotus follicularis]